MTRNFRRKCQLQEIDVSLSRGSLRKKSAFGRARDDVGASLILALIYITAISLIVVSLAGWVSNDLNNTVKFSNAAQFDSALRSVTELGIQNIRYYPLDGVAIPGPGECWQPAGGGSVSSQTINGYTVAVWCSTVQNLASAQTRLVTLDACLLSSSVTAAVAEANCLANPALQAKVAFDDYLPGNSPIASSTCTVTCGSSAITQYWSFGSTGGAVPTPSTTTTLSGATTTTTPTTTTSPTTSTTTTSTTTSTTSTTTTSTTTTTTIPVGSPRGTSITTTPNNSGDYTPDSNDIISFTYNQVMKPSSFVSGWNGSSAIPVFAQLTRVIRNPTILTLCSDSACNTPVNLGTVSLGDAYPNVYVPYNSTVILNASMSISTSGGGSVVVVTLTSSSGSVSAVSSNTILTWNPSAAATNTVNTGSSTTAVVQSTAVKNF